MLKLQSTAPDFTLSDQDGKEITLSSLRGKKVVLYFYPRDNTSGCTKQACAFAAAQKDFAAVDAIIVGISKDTAVSHRRFADKYDLPFTLLADPALGVLKAYGVWQEKKMCGKVSMGVVRTTYVLDEKGVIVWAKEKVKPEENPGEILAWLKGE